MPPVESSPGHPRPLDELNKLAEYGLEIKNDVRDSFEIDAITSNIVLK